MAQHGRGVRTAGILVVVAATCLWAAPAPGQPGTGSSDDAAAAAAAQGQVATETTALVGDFNGDRRKDLFWYGPGAAVDRLWLGRANGGFAGVAISVKGTYRPFVGSFDGDGRLDIFWYASGAPPDYVWYRRARAAGSRR